MATSKLSKEARKPQNIEVSNVNSQDISNVNNLNIPKYKASEKLKSCELKRLTVSLFLGLLLTMCQHQCTQKRYKNEARSSV